MTFRNQVDGERTGSWYWFRKIVRMRYPLFMLSFWNLLFLGTFFGLAACSGSITPGGGCRDSAGCLKGFYCAGPNDRPVCGVPPRESCDGDTQCPGGRCHSISDSCSPDGVGSECRPPCTVASCGAGFRCNPGGACEPVPCDEGFTCPTYLRCDPAVAHRPEPAHALSTGCVEIPCASDAACPAGTACVNARCQDGSGSCKEDIPVP